MQIEVDHLGLIGQIWTCPCPILESRIVSRVLLDRVQIQKIWIQEIQGIDLLVWVEVLGWRIRRQLAIARKI